MQHFVEKNNGERRAITATQCEALRRHHKYQPIISTKSMMVVKNLSLPPKPQQRLVYGGARHMRNPYSEVRP